MRANSSDGQPKQSLTVRCIILDLVEDKDWTDTAYPSKNKKDITLPPEQAIRIGVSNFDATESCGYSAKETWQSYAVTEAFSWLFTPVEQLPWTGCYIKRHKAWQQLDDGHNHRRPLFQVRQKMPS